MSGTSAARVRALLALCLSAGFGACRARVPEVYVTDERLGRVLVIDSNHDRVVRAIALHSRARGIAVDPRSGRISVALTNLNTSLPGAAAGVAAVDPARRNSVQRLAAGSDPDQVALSPDGDRLWVSNEDAAAASAVDLIARRLTATVPVGAGPEGVAITPDGREVWVTGETSNDLSVIDEAKRSVVARVPVDQRPRGVLFSSDGARAYVTSEIGGSFSVVDTATRRVVNRLPLTAGSRPMGVALSPEGKIVYVTTGRGGAVAFVDLAGPLLVGACAPARGRGGSP